MATEEELLELTEEELHAKVSEHLDALHTLCETFLTDWQFEKAEKEIDKIGAQFGIDGGFGSSAA